ncbi:hypothetical protein [Arthrobacter sp. 9MFCol3.1]|uniref:hypothetical protein n=1 Tax=Arthrobacter sp. 9MFCol3.1 TaxID=1150398 RepID=UPI0018CC50A1|nr:hypothetical protein [Arthrobacter sp. 9MFCol3.1]
MATESKDIWAELRKPVDPKAVGQLPKPTKKENPKGICTECGGYHGMPAVHLDYVGHAAVTDRLITVDPEWTWEPVALDERGLPQYDNAGGLWIRLTIGGVTRLGYGDGETPKERIGDALRNAAMRFGVALDLWSKDELESNIENPDNKNVKPSEAKPHVSETTKPVQTYVPPASKPGLINPASMDELKALLVAKSLTGDKATEYSQWIIGKDKPENESDVQGLIAALKAKS